MGKFDEKDFGAVLQSAECLSWNIPVDGSEGMLEPVVPVNWMVGLCGLGWVARIKEYPGVI